MRISYLELRNYRRFKELKLQFPDGIVGILGLNGVGKTTIIEAVAWALFGNVDEVVRTAREGVRRSGAKSSENCAAVLEFELGGTEFRIEREMGGKSLSMRAELRSKGTVLAEGDKPVRRMVEKLIGMDHKSFFTSVFARQKELNALQNVAAGERKKVVLRMLRIDGIDDVLTRVRADRKDAQSRTEGAQKTLLTEDGREKEAVLKERLPSLEEALGKASEELSAAERKEASASKEAEETKVQRDALKKDVDAYTASSGDLKAIASTIAEKRAHEGSIAKKIADAAAKLAKLPEHEDAERAWEQSSKRKAELEKEKGKSDRAKMLRQEATADEKEEARRLDELARMRSGEARPDDILLKIDDVEGQKGECQAQRANISGRIGELRSRAAERREAAAKDRRKLEEISRAGKEGVCPTCERRLDEAYDLLVRKLTESSEEAAKAERECAGLMSQLEAELRALASKEDALKKKRVSLDLQLKKINQTETSIREREGELANLRERLAQRKRSVLELGEIRFSDEEFARVSADYERLRVLHEEHVRLRALKEQSERYARDLEDLKEQIRRCEGEEAQYRAMVLALEPKKKHYDSVVKVLDEKTAALNAAKDAVRRFSSVHERAQGEVERTKGELEGIAKTKKTIAQYIKKAEDLAMLEDVVVNFKDHLIGRVAPVLSELTSKGLEAMTEGRYARVSLDDNYEMQIEDQGVQYPIDRFSGGESDLANLSLRLAISRIIADRTGATPINFLILDEIFGSQDPNRKRSVMVALSRLSAQFRQIFLITHIEDVKDSLSYVIRVHEAEDGTSSAEIAS